jgi:hypothetical protein
LYVERQVKPVVHDATRIALAALSRRIRRLLWLPQANAVCERLIGTIRRECLDWVIPVNEQHLRTILREWPRI